MFRNPLHLVLNLGRHACMMVFISLLMCNISYAYLSNAQNVKSVKDLSLEIEFHNKSIIEVFREIEKSTEYAFAYDQSDIDPNLKITKKYDHSNKVADILYDISKDAGLTFKQINNNIIVTKPNFEKDIKNSEIEVILQTRNITGRITSKEDGEGLPGVNIIERGTSNGTISNADGVYSLTVSEGATLTFSSVGYVTQEFEVGSRSVIDIVMAQDIQQLDELVVIGYGTVKKSDLTGSVMRVRGEDFRTQSMTQINDMLTGTVAGFNANQSTSAAGGSSMEIRGPTSLSAGTEPLIILDGVIYKGSLRDINPNDIESIDILKDASSAAVFGSKAASGVVILTTTKGKLGKPTINFSSKVGSTENNNQRRGLGPDEYVQFRQDYFRQMFVDRDYNFYTHPDELPGNLTLDQWFALSAAPLADPLDEWLTRMRFFPEEQQSYHSRETIDWYDKVYRSGLRQDYHISIGGGTEAATYYWSFGYNDNEGIRVGDQYASVRTTLNADFKVVDWLNVGVNAQYSDRDESSVPVSTSEFYSNSPFAQMYDDSGNLKRYPHGHSDNPLLAYYRTSRLNKTNNLFANLYADVTLPFDIKYRFSYQPRYQAHKYLNFVTISEALGGTPTEVPTGQRNEATRMDWMIDNLITWNKAIGVHNFDVTLLANIEENKYWSTSMSNRNFSPNQELKFHGLHFGNSPEIINDDNRSTGDALMARLNYTLMSRYLLTASIRRDGYSAFGTENPRAVFPAFALAWIVSEESFYKIDLINWFKVRLSWGVNGNRDIGMYSALARTGADLWFDGSNVRVGVQNSTLANTGLKWERTSALNLGLDIALLENRINLTVDAYDMTTTDLLMNRILPRVTGFSNIMANLGELRNRGFELTLNTKNINQTNFSWKSDFVFSLNRNKIIKLFGDIGTYTLLGEERTGEVPDYSNGWFPGQAIDVVWNYNVTGIWQLNEADQALNYKLQPGDFKALDVDNDSKYVDLLDKQFIGHTAPRYRLGFNNDFTFLGRFTASVFLRSDLGHIGSYSVALNSGHESNDRRNRNVGPVPYWTADNPNNEYARLNPDTAPFGGGIMIYKPRSFVRVQDVSLTYNLPSTLVQRLGMIGLDVFTSIRNLATFTKWPGWDPESGMTPMPRTYTFGLNLSL